MLAIPMTLARPGSSARSPDFAGFLLTARVYSN